jgi:putative hydrolase of the HAD superfamily
LRQLKGRGLLLAAATNYGARGKQRMKELGAFDLLDLWSETPVKKPAAGFFEENLRWLEVAPAEAVMVGDRMDNDIAPAKAAGLWAVRVSHGYHREQRPRSPEEAPDFEAQGIADATAWILERAR